MMRLSEFLAEQWKGTYKNCKKKKKISVKVVFVRKSLILFHYSWSQLDRWAIQYVESKNKIHVDADFADFADF